MNKISLTRGAFAIVDDGDIETVSAHKWQLLKTGYAATSVGGRLNKKMVYMHRLIAGAIKGQVVDHIDHDKLNNSRSNLRVCSQSENGGNSRVVKRDQKTSKFKGVYFDRSRSKWSARIKVQYKGIFLGRFDSEKEAAIAYNNAAKLHFGEFACLNQV